MVYLSRKNGHIGELRIVVTELDRAELFVSGPRWIDINDTINKFNEDPEVDQLYLTASYAGDLKDEKLSEFINNVNNEVNSQIVNGKKDKDKKDDEKQKVHSDGSEEEDEEETEEEKTSREEIKEFLSDYDLKCEKCGDEDKALVDAEGNLHDCEACIKIDAYLKGKKEGFADGYEKGYAECIKHLQKISNDITVTEPEEKKEDNKDEK